MNMERLLLHVHGSTMLHAGLSTTRDRNLLDQYNLTDDSVTIWIVRNLRWNQLHHPVYVWDGDWKVDAVTGGLS